MRKRRERKIRVSLTSAEWADVRAAVIYARQKCATSFAENKEAMEAKYQRLCDELEEQIVRGLRGAR
ncbi:MAG: hypothetical protein KDJ44_06995 [Rhodoblastus sp.]|nr:hypothetical protein [Rhodoblastus sp.]